ncbi:MAG: phage holin [Clostridiales bacterium]|nr:phage holin [Clostridiales bacterium]
MNINWKIRMKNKVWLTALFSAAVSFVFDLLALFDIAPALTQEGVMSALSALLTLLTALGVVIDPTTPGVQDVSQKC